jgi:hypothetical protein
VNVWLGILFFTEYMSQNEPSAVRRWLEVSEYQLKTRPTSALGVRPLKTIFIDDSLCLSPKRVPTLPPNPAWAPAFLFLIPFALATLPTTLFAQSACTHYASPNGGGNGSSTSSPFRITDFIAIAAPGNTLCLLNGTYQGDASTVSISDKSGTLMAPITIRALNDGQALIDGQFGRLPIRLSGSNYWILEGFNAKQGRDSVVSLVRSHNNILRRIVAWDAWIHTNSLIWEMDASTNNLIEDVAAFGTGGKVIAAGYGSPVGSPRNILRRVWARYEGSVHQSYAQSISLSYGTWQGATCENCLATHSKESQPENYYLTLFGVKQSPANPDPSNPSQNSCSFQRVFGGQCPQPISNYNIMGDAAGMINATQDGSCSDTRVYGSLAYFKSPIYGNAISDVFSTFAKCQTLNHVLVFVDSLLNQYNGIRGFYQGPNSTGTMTNTTTITSSTRPDNLNGDWTRSNNVTAPSLSALASTQNPFTGTQGAQLCMRWVNEQKTNEPLWPWPMNERIKAATASAGNYFANGGPGCGPNQGECTGTLGQMRKATDVTADVEAMFGAIPSQCRGSGPPTPPPAPTPSPVPSNSTAFTIGQRVEIKEGPAIVRDSPGGNLLGNQPTGALGTVVGGAMQSTSGNIWWQINFDRGVDGWSTEGVLAAVDTIAPTVTITSPVNGTVVQRRTP